MGCSEPADWQVATLALAFTHDAILFSDAGLKQHGDPIAGYDAVLKINPKYADSLYGRGVAKLKKGDNDGGNSDIASAKAIKPDLADDFIRYGVR
jgi:hypothetical protein